jgi:iron complex transport system ATP-binding protein
VPHTGMCAIIGPNGAGKSTLLRIITNIIRPAKGEISINNKNINKMSRLETARNIAVVPDNFTTDFDFTVFDIVLMARYAHNNRSYADKNDLLKTEEALVKTGTIHLKNNLYKTLSSGERQTVLLARAIAQDCPVILLDEPTSNLDIKNQMEIMSMLKTLNEENKCVIAIMHDINLAVRFIENFIILKNGRIINSGNIKSIFREETLSDLYDIDVDIFKDANSDYWYMQARK